MPIRDRLPTDPIERQKYAEKLVRESTAAYLMDEYPDLFPDKAGAFAVLPRDDDAWPVTDPYTVFPHQGPQEDA